MKKMTWQMGIVRIETHINHIHTQPERRGNTSNTAYSITVEIAKLWWFVSNQQSITRNRLSAIKD
jgi:hypothetical protein